MDRFDKFTDRARKVLTLAQDEAQRFNHNYIGTEHLLLGLVREGEGVAARVLDVTRGSSRVQSGYLYHYAFAMLIGIAAFITWFMFYGGGH